MSFQFIIVITYPCKYESSAILDFGGFLNAGCLLQETYSAAIMILCDFLSELQSDFAGIYQIQFAASSLLQVWWITKVTTISK